MEFPFGLQLDQAPLLGFGVPGRVDDARERHEPFSLEDVVDVAVLESHVDNSVFSVFRYDSTQHALEAAEIRGYEPKMK